MLEFGTSLRATYLRLVGSRPVTHAEKALFLTAYLGGNVVGQIVKTADFKKRWPKSLFGVVFHAKYLAEAEDNEWIDRSRAGQFSLTDEGLTHLVMLTDDSTRDALADNTELIVFSPKQAHDFDKFLRQALASAKVRVRIADSYVDETIFDTVLHVINSSVDIDLMFNHDSGSLFYAHAKRFKIQFPKFTYARYPKLHDRYIVIDDIGFVIGPSLKDATVNSPAILVRVGSAQSAKLISLFDNIYAHRTKIS